MRQGTKTITSGWGFGACGPLLPEDEMNVLAGFLTCKDPAASSVTAPPLPNHQLQQQRLDDPLYSIDRLYPAKTPASSPRPWAAQTGSSGAPIDIQDASIVETRAATKPKVNRVMEIKERATRPVRETRQDAPVRTRRAQAMGPPMDQDDNSITEQEPAPRFPGSEVAAAYRRRSQPSVAERKSNIRLTPEGRTRTTHHHVSAAAGSSTGIELRKVFENEEFVTFRKVAYSGRSSIPFSMHDNELQPDDDDGDEYDSQSRLNKAHQVLVVTNKKRSPR